MIHVDCQLAAMLSHAEYKLLSSIIVYTKNNKIEISSTQVQYLTGFKASLFRALIIKLEGIEAVQVIRREDPLLGRVVNTYLFSNNFISIDKKDEKPFIGTNCIRKIKKEKLEKAGAIYLIKVDLQDSYKIGFATNLEKRFLALSASNLQLELIHTILGTSVLERQLHKKFEQKRINREIFNLSKEDIDFIKSIKDFSLLKEKVDYFDNTQKSFEKDISDILLTNNYKVRLLNFTKNAFDHVRVSFIAEDANGEIVLSRNFSSPTKTSAINSIIKSIKFKKLDQRNIFA